jgi:gliding motility-associated-like protein
MPTRLFKLFFVLLLSTFCQVAYAQQDIDFHLSNTFLAGKNIIKVKRDFNDPYLWVLTQNSEVYRINSETLVVDDYTPKFAAYSNLNFIDIAGNSGDEVFIAQADKVIRFKNGAITTITNNDGLAGQVNTVYFNISAFDTQDENGDLTVPDLMISTSTGVYHYYTGSDRLVYANLTDYTVTVGTYKSLMIFDKVKDPTYTIVNETHQVSSAIYQSSYTGYIFLDPIVFGTQLKATYYNGGYDYYGSRFGYLGNQFWATEKGLFQNSWDHSYDPNYHPYNHYLENNHINQISSIYGLTSLGYQSSRENLLVATDEGLYISNSKFFPEQPMRQYQFYHYAGLANKKINYIDVNAFVTHSGINTALNLLTDYCENGVWVGANDGLYLIRPDYTDYFDQNQPAKVIWFDGKGPDETTIDLCPGITTHANIYLNTNPNIQWYKNGKELQAESNKKLEINSAGEYYAVLYDPCSGLHVQTNRLTVNYLDGATVPLNYPDKMSYCFGSTATLSVPNNPDFKYRWYKNGVLNGITTSQINITEDGKYKLEVNTCQDVWIPTKEVEVKFIKIPVPILATDKTILCAGEEAILTAAVPSDVTGITNWAAYTYRWYKDGVLLPTTTATLQATVTGKYKVEASSCAGNSATSAEVQINVVTLPDPQITSAKDSYCTGETAQLNTNVVLDPSYDITWYKDNQPMPANLDKTAISVTVGGSYSMSVTSKLTASACRKDALAKLIPFVPGPTFTFNYPGLLTKCAGEPVELKVDGSPSYKYRWYKNGVLNGQIINVITVTDAGKYKAEVSVCENSWVTTTEVEVKYIQLPAPIITADKAGYCIGDNASLSVNVPINPNYLVNWYLDGAIITEWQNLTSVTTHVAGVYTVKVLGSLPMCEQVSPVKSIVFIARPVISIQRSINTSLCYGQTVELSVDQTGGSVRWSTGETTSKISVTQPGNYKAFYTSAGGCQTEASTDVAFLAAPVLNLFDGAICAFKKETFTLTAPAGFVSYSWNNGESTSATFEVSKPQTVTLTVTDANNCRATQQIQIKNQCPDVHLANTFTPNGDSINDTWLITGLEDDPTVNVKVFNRGGSLVFEDKGNTKSWDGTFNGKKLSTGVYYYIISTKGSSEILKGSVTIIY